MEVIVKVERLWMDNKIHRAGDVIDIPEERIARLGTSVERLVLNVEKLDERDAQINALKAKVEELEIALAVVSTPVESSMITEMGAVADMPTSVWTTSEIKRHLDDMGIEYGVRMSKSELLELANSKR